MPHHMAYCSACDRPVPVDFKSGARPDARLEQPDAAELVCLEYPSRCTASMCPMFSVADDDAGARAMIENEHGREPEPRP